MIRPHAVNSGSLRLMGELLPILDLLLLLAAAWLATRMLANGTTAPAVTDWTAEGRTTLVAAALLPFFVRAHAATARWPIIDHGYRVALLAVAVIGLGKIGGFTDGVPGRWLLSWLAMTLAATMLSRWLLSALRIRLTASGLNVERIAVVGAGPAADRLARQLHCTLGHRLRLVGVFDDRRPRCQPASQPPQGSVADLLVLGRRGQVDAVLLTLPASADARIAQLVRPLKTLAIPVLLCPANLGLPDSGVEFLPVDRARRPSARVPEWLAGLLLSPVDVLLRIWQRRRRPLLRLSIDDHDVGSFSQLAAAVGVAQYRYVVTPNADHLLRLHRDPDFRALYRQASYTLLDSQLIAHLYRLLRGQRLPICPGSDLVARLFDQVIHPDDTLILIGASDAQAARLVADHGLRRLHHYNPPMGFIDDPAAVADCLAFVEAHSPFRFCLLAVGCPQQERLASALQHRGIARGLALCVGASIDFITGRERRAPRLLQRAGLEWLYRLLQSPRRLARRYLVNAPRLLTALPCTVIELRPADPPPPPTVIEMKSPALPHRAAASLGTARRSRRSGFRAHP